ncbi:MAG: hypothetical protein WD771_02495 [Gemmatimonadaceae bacterium]
MTDPSIDLVYFEGCPNADEARRRLRTALQAVGLPATWSEWDSRAESTPERLRRFGSPTVLIDGRPVGEAAEMVGAGCVVAGAPSTEALTAALRGARQ